MHPWQEREKEAELKQREVELRERTQREVEAMEVRVRHEVLEASKEAQAAAVVEAEAALREEAVQTVQVTTAAQTAEEALGVDKV